MLHVIRRNVDLQILLFNNEIYGLTKGQYSPTSRVGTRSPSTPMGSVDAPISPCAFALGAGARFVARGIDTAQKELPGTLARAHAHKGASFVEIFQNCIVYNDAVFDYFTAKPVAADLQIHVEHGKPLIFGKEKNKGLRLNTKTLTLEVVTVGENGITLDDIQVHDETNRMLANMLVSLQPPEFPIVLGVIYCDPKPSFETAIIAQVKAAEEKKPDANINALLRAGKTWTVS
jgi:2-oxoglutarate/2-oxoacid ferredoxin oxidoreductase subunit beta